MEYSRRCAAQCLSSRTIRDVILPMVVLRRLDALLEPTKEAVEQEYKSQIEAGLADNIDEEALKEGSPNCYFDVSKKSIKRPE